MNGTVMMALSVDVVMMALSVDVALFQHRVETVHKRGL